MHNLGSRLLLRQSRATSLILTSTSLRRPSSFSSISSLVISQRTINTDRTYYDYLDSIWNRQWFGATEMLTPVPETSLFSNIFVNCQQYLGIEPAVAIILLGGLSRICTLYFSLYGERASERMRNAMYRLKKPHENFQRIYYREGASSLEIQLAATSLKGERRRVFYEEQTSNIKCLSSLLGTPIVLFGLFQTTSLCENPQLDIGTSSFLWCTALTMPDPYGILPCICCALTLMNFELSINKELKKKGWMLNLIWGARLGCICILPAFVQIRSGVALYFIGMSLIGLIQPLLLRSSIFRKWFDFPTQEQVEKAKSMMEKNNNDDDIHTRMSVQFPYLTHLFNPESEENTSLLKDAEIPLKNKNIQHNSAGYAKGNNPFMREDVAIRSVRNKSYYSNSSSLGASKTKLENSTTASRKGVDFATSGWKAARVEFSEEDFIPEVGDSYNGKENGKK